MGCSTSTIRGTGLTGTGRGKYGASGAHGDSLLDLLRDTLCSDSTGTAWCVMSETDRGMCRGFASKAMRQLGDSSALNRSGVGFSCRKGLKPESLNQDSFVAMGIEGDLAIYGVFDGHGCAGHEVSNFVKENLPRLIIQDRRFRTSSMMEMLQECFRDMQKMISEATRCNRLNARMSGTTATIVIHDFKTKTITVAHAGDSGACVGKMVSARPGGTFSAEAITQDHKPELEEERSRIESAGGRVMFDGYANHRVYAGNSRAPGLNMSRSLGDLLGHTEAGLSCEPAVRQIPLTPGHKMLILCSDGVWEFIPPARAVRVAADFTAHSAMMAAERLAKDAWDCWVREEGGTVVDDITALVIFLEPGATRRSEATAAARASPFADLTEEQNLSPSAKSVGRQQHLSEREANQPRWDLHRTTKPVSQDDMEASDKEGVPCRACFLVGGSNGP